MRTIRTPPYALHKSGAGRLIAALIAGIVPGHLHAQALPPPNGAYPVGVTRVVLVDSTRDEPLTPDSHDRREVVVQIWYPARDRSGLIAPYALDSALWREAFGANASSRFSGVRTNAVRNAPGRARRSLPVVLVSPAAGSDPGFYAGIAEELSSRGFIVAALGHPYEKPSLRLSGGTIATERTSPPDADVFRATHERVLWRAQDLRFVLTRLAKGLDQPAGLQADAQRAIAAGHSRGGVSALEACKRDARFRACVNIDGGVLGGPYYADSAGAGPRAQMLWLQAYHPSPADSQLVSWKMTRAQWDSFDIRANRMIARAAGGGWRVIIPDTVHEAFSDIEWVFADSAGKGRAVETLLTVRALLFQYAASVTAGRSPSFDRFVRQRRILSAEWFSERQ